MIDNASQEFSDGVLKWLQADLETHKKGVGGIERVFVAMHIPPAGLGVTIHVEWDKTQRFEAGTAPSRDRGQAPRLARDRRIHPGTGRDAHDGSPDPREPSGPLRTPVPAHDLVFPREDGKQRLVSGTYKQFKADLQAVGIPTQRQYESRSTFRNLALSAGASEFHVSMITHPKPRRASDFYTRLEMQWPGMCDTVRAIDPAAWTGSPATVTSDEVTTRVTGKGTTDEKPPTSVENVGGKMEREKGFEVCRTVNANYATAHAFLSFRPS